jgi:hypothetical protein
MSEGLNTLDELLRDPIIQLVMARDNVQPEDLRRSLERARRAAEQPSLPPHVIAACRALRLCA